MAAVSSTGCGERYDLGPASFSVSSGGTLRIVVCDDFELTKVNAYVTWGAGSVDLLDLHSSSSVQVGAGEDILAAVEGQTVTPVTRNLRVLPDDADYIGIYIEGTASGLEQAWTAGVRAPFTLGEDNWMKPDGSVHARPC